MTSFRRSLSPCIHDRSLENGTAFAAVNLSSSGVPCSSPGFPSASTVALADLSLNGRSSWVTDKLKMKGSVWKKPFLHVIICFFVGFLVGLTPVSLPWPVVFKDVRHDFGLEVKGFHTHLQHEEDSFGEREKHVEAVKANDMILNQSSSSKVVTNLLKQVLKSHQVTDPTFGKLLIVITPTYNRPFQAAYLTRLSHTLKLVPPPLLWLVAEMPVQSMETAILLRNTGLMYRHIVCNKNLTDVKDRGVHQRNAALAHIEQHQLDGVVYFADDDNVYTLELFQQMRTIKRFGTWPVAMLTQNKSKTILEGPVCDGHMVIGWHTNEKSKRLRRFHVDMSGFAFNSTLLWDRQLWQKPNMDPIRQLDDIKEGFQETTFIEQLVEDESQMEGLPSGCSKVMVWHLHLEAMDSVYPPGWKLDYNINGTISSH